ncbi:hypothetical protein [Thauera sp. Sel9]|uniref:hypothetical protein n=1 Tax=Thauera sp. Sel9 TaxID=2974299 RepID=UPI0021E10D73|nr:hypothetical protein [Thauera sp. Sel9]MCV2218395.1 hypothetical protein [Thauera sp. Sel9]
MQSALQIMVALGIALAFSCSAPDSAHASEPEGSPASLTGFGRIIDTEVLDTQRGGSDVHLSEIHASGAVSEVQAYDLVTGHNIVSDNALAGAAGLPMVIQNSGNGVLIQNAVILNVQVQ